MHPDPSRQQTPRGPAATGRNASGSESSSHGSAGLDAGGPDAPGPEAGARESDRRGEASGQHQALRRDVDDKRAKQRLGDVGLDDRGDAFEDEQRDRHSRGAPPDGGTQ